MVLPSNEGTLSTFNCQYWADRRHATAITQGARGVTTADDLVLLWVPRTKGAAHDHPDGARATLLATPTATSTDRNVTTAAPPEDLGHVYHAAKAGGLGLLNDGREPRIQVRRSYQVPLHS